MLDDLRRGPQPPEGEMAEDGETRQGEEDQDLPRDPERDPRNVTEVMQIRAPQTVRPMNLL